MRVVVTGGAGFIGSHLAEALLARGDQVVVLDDLSSGFAEHVPSGAEMVKGDVADLSSVRAVVEGAGAVLHHAAARAVLRSVQDPLETDRINTGGTLNVLVAAQDAGVRRVILASSSSVYGGVGGGACREGDPARPRSPYAVSKLAGEHYARVFSELHGLETVVLRYFNVFGPRQRPDAPYAAVVPLFIQALLAGEQPVIEGDGLQSRDFTYIDDVVAANLAALDAPAERVSGHIFNVARGEQTTVRRLLESLCRLMVAPFQPRWAPPRHGDVRASQADIARAAARLGFTPHVALEDGLARTVDWLRAAEAWR